MRRILSAVAGVVLVAGPAWGDDETDRKVMFAASVTLATSTYRIGQIVVDSADSAHLSDGSSLFKRVSDCVYSQSPREGSTDKFFAEIDFSALTGNYHFRRSLAGTDLIMEGRSPRTRCFLIAGNKGCAADVLFPSLGPDDIRRVIDDVAYILNNACPEKGTDPY